MNSNTTHTGCLLLKKEDVTCKMFAVYKYIATVSMFLVQPNNHFSIVFAMRDYMPVLAKQYISVFK